MRLTFLGTSGSEGYPAAFCRCERCATARLLGGKNIRRRSSLLIDDDLLLDLGPDVPAALQDLRLDLADLRYLLITHAHDDHFLPITLKYRLPRYGAPALERLTVFGSAPTLARLGALPVDATEAALETTLATPGEWLEAGPYRILPLAARHAETSGPRLYIVSRGSATVLYATDTGAFPASTWELLRGLHLNAVVLDATFWTEPSDDDHLSLDDVIDHRRELLRQAVIDEQTFVLATHLSHRSQPDHAHLLARLAGTGVTPAHDGLILNVE